MGGGKLTAFPTRRLAGKPWSPCQDFQLSSASGARPVRGPPDASRGMGAGLSRLDTLQGRDEVWKGRSKGGA